jgi:glycosyltransferase involved in cell wall biosynthesis
MHGAHIGVDATSWHNARGYGRYTRALLGALVDVDRGNDYTLVLDAPECVEDVPRRARTLLVTTSVPAALAASADGRRSLADMWRMSRTLSQGGFDALLFPTVYSFVPVVARARKIVFIHDVIAERYPHLTFSNRFARTLWSAKVALGRWQADAIVTISEFSKRCLVEHFGLAPERVFVVEAASDPVFRVLDGSHESEELERAGVPPEGRLLVYVGGFGPHKNLIALAEAFSRIARRAAYADARLVFVGEYRHETFYSTFARLRERIDALGISDRVTFTGFLSDEGLTALLNRATALVQPSLIEGVGLPALEAAACGCAVVATKESALPELLGEGGIFFDPSDDGALEAAITRLLDSEEVATRVRAAALVASRQLTWDRAARQLVSVIHGVVAR